MTKRRMTLAAVVALLAVAGLIGAACSGGTAENAGGGGISGEAPARDVAVGAPSPAPAEPGAPGFPADDATGAVSGVASVPALGAKVIKTAQVSVTVRPGTFQDRFQQATVIAGSHGGFVASSGTAEGKFRSGSLVIRVPARDFETALGELRKLGRVRSQSLSGEDVTGRVVDLEARLRNWQAQETVLLRLMAKARTIEDSIVVQRQLQEVQLQIEEIKGQLRALEDQTEFSTISLSLSEAGFVPPQKKKSAGLTFGRAWDLALHGFVAVFAAVLVGLGYLVPIVLLGAAAVTSVVAYRRFRRVPTPS